MIVELQANPIAAVKTLIDRFTENRKPGQVIGTRTPEGVRRGGIDKEKSISIDNGALRIQPLINAGWGRVGVAYEPYRRGNGLTLAVFMLNGHNTSQTGGLGGEKIRSRMQRWLLGSGTYSKMRRVAQYLASKRLARAFRQFRWWFALDQGGSAATLDENLAVGWFAREVPENPLSEGNAFVMHATGPENGELWATVGAAPMPTIRSVQNLQLYYLIILRQKGAAYYAASVPDANGLPAFPAIRPLAIDPFNDADPVYPGIHQSVLGQIGFRLDTRVYGVTVDQLPQFSDWFGTAHAADLLEGSGSLRHTKAEAGGVWRVHEGEFERGGHGASPSEEKNLAILDPGAPSGLIHVISHAGVQGSATAGLIWRFRDRENCWRLLVSTTACELSVQENGVWTQVAASDQWRLEAGAANSIQILDDGQTMGFHLRGELVFGTRFRDPRLQASTGVGLYAPKGDLHFHSFETHPRTVSLPETLHMGEPWLRKGLEAAVADDFSGPAGELAGRLTTTGGKTWHKQIGAGTMETTGDGALKIKATAKNPNPGRTTYVVDWDYPEFTDVAVEITPPGTAPGQSEHGLCGFILWQDPDNYITVNIWLHEYYSGASISCFFHLDGFEDLYDAIWSNVGKRVYYGVPSTLRLVFDGLNYTAFVNDEPVLYRALTDIYPGYRRFSINRVGLLANWEWGNDTGSTFRNFVARV